MVDSLKAAKLGSAESTESNFSSHFVSIEIVGVEVGKGEGFVVGLAVGLTVGRSVLTMPSFKG